MSYVKFFYYNLVRQSPTDILPDNEDAFFPASNIKSHLRSKVYRTPTSTLDAGIVFDFKTVEPVDSVLILPTYEGRGFVGDVVIKANATNASWGSPAFSTTVSVDDKFNIGFNVFTEQNYRFWRIEASNPTGEYVEIGKVFIGKQLNFEETNSNIDFGWSWLYRDPSKIQRNRYSERYVDKLPKLDGISASLNLLTREEMGIAMDMFLHSGTTEPVWFITDYDAIFSDDRHRFSTYGFFSSVPQPKNDSFRLYSLSFRIDQ